MLTGNGRHRRPRQAPALLVAAGVTGSAIALPLLGAASAHAADGTTWDKVAECESGGSWSQNSGNGYYGGLQISQDDWDKYGGAQYADSADQASRNQQIAVAEKILAAQGTKPWTMCALTAGLTSDSGSVDVDTGVGSSGNSGNGKGSGDDSGSTDNSDSSGLSDSSGADSGSGDGSGSRSGSDAGASSDAGATPGPSASDGNGRGAGASHGSKGADGHKSDKGDKGGKAGASGSGGSTGSSGGGGAQGEDSSPSATPGTDESDDYGQGAGSWSLVDTGALSSGGRHRGGSADESVTNGQDAASPGRHAGRETDTYTVREGDTLASIADSLGVDGGWRALYDGNKKVVGADPNQITAGQTLEVGHETDAE
ncbi:peptigoglycan-binding protein LysM [Streptomyces sp. MUSC 14]|uniref:LysM peptidoglycan-binding domain-containing protein n=1 Tax=Streptomyces sp. MUSC 14 TaxID=1354889 RepID=UPI0008F5F4ED|nr:transglycosylase family protein [Streptomyces sp. MUSC 14]OIJ93486.1 peptigoglycan-binding protein LysM [Streptomyces sp. MUSC 14]